MNDATYPTIGVDFRIDPKRNPLRMRFEPEMSKRKGLHSPAYAERKSREADEAGCAGNMRHAYATHNVGSCPLGPLADDVFVGAVEVKLIESYTLPERLYGRPGYTYF